jgi:hypothetical protein
MLTYRLLRLAIVSTMAITAGSLLTLADPSAGAFSGQQKAARTQESGVLLAFGSVGTASVVTVTTTTPGPPLIPGSGDCGMLFLASGWPTTTMPGPQATTCIYAALRTGRSATLTEVAETDGLGGHPRVTTFRVTARDRLLVTINSTKAKPRGTVQEWRCIGLATRADEIVATSCKKR